jgi:mono/diheme cytochrome c family protein
MPTHRRLWTGGIAALLLAAAPAWGADELRGDPHRGEALYVGTVPLVNGGAPCLACHGVAGHGLARAASFGPDLTGTHESYGPAALDAALEDIPYPSMQPVYRGHAINAQERADVVAFLRDASGGRPPALGAGFGLAIAGAMVALFGAFVWIGRRGARRASAGRRTA